MAAASISQFSPTVKYNPVLPSPSTLFFAKTKAQPSSTPTAVVPKIETLSVKDTSTPSTPHPLSSTTAVAATTVSSSGNGNGTSVFSKSIVQHRRQPLGTPIRLVLQQRRNQYQHRSTYGHGHPLLQQIQNHIRNNTQSSYHLLSPGHKRTQSIQLADRLEGVMSNPLLQGPLSGVISNMDIAVPSKAQSIDVLEEDDEESRCCPDYVYTAPCEHHPSKGQTDYLVNDMFPRLQHDLSTIEFGIRIVDFMPLAFKTVPVVGLAEKELELLHSLGTLPNVIQLQDSFVNDNGDTVLVLPMLKRFDCQAVNKNICSVRKTIKQVLTGLAAVHAKNIVHLDINPSNLMVTHNKKDVVVIDFGLSMTVNRHTENEGAKKIPVCGTTGYIAPEIINPQFYGAYDPTASDLYSLGIVLGEILEPYIPDCGLEYFGSKYLCLDNTNQTANALKDFVAQDMIFPRVLIQAADLLKNMLEENPKDRKSAQELLDSHPFLNVSPSAGASATLELCDWMFRVQDIKYQKFMCQEQNGCEVYRYR